MLKRSEQIFNKQSAAQKMKIFNEMETFIKQQKSSDINEIAVSNFQHEQPVSVNQEVLSS